MDLAFFLNFIFILTFIFLIMVICFGLSFVFLISGNELEIIGLIRIGEFFFKLCIVVLMIFGVLAALCVVLIFVQLFLL